MNSRKIIKELRSQALGSDYLNRQSAAFFLHRPEQMKYAAKAAHGRAAGREKTSLPDCPEICYHGFYK